MRTSTLDRRSRRTHQMVRTIALVLIAGILGASLAFIIFDPDGARAPASNGSGNSNLPHGPAAQQMTPEGGHMHASSANVATLLTAEPEAVPYCVGGSLEPYDGAMEQLRISGPAEAAERMRTCVFDAFVGHGDEATMADLESHRGLFESCFGELQTTEPADKSDAVARVSACIAAGLAPP